PSTCSAKRRTPPPPARPVPATAPRTGTRTAVATARPATPGGPCDMSQYGLPPKQGLYDPQYEHDACGVGFVVDLKGRKSHALVEQAIQVLLNLQHRGACGCEKNTGDGAGILLQTPHRFLAQECDKLKIKLPAQGEYGVGMVFLPTNPDDQRRCEELFEQSVCEEGCTPLGWRTVPTDNSSLGP